MPEWTPPSPLLLCEILYYFSRIISKTIGIKTAGKRPDRPFLNFLDPPLFSRGSCIKRRVYQNSIISGFNLDCPVSAIHIHAKKAFSFSPSFPARFLFFCCCCFYHYTQREPLQGREPRKGRNAGTRNSAELGECFHPVAFKYGRLSSLVAGGIEKQNY